MSLCRVLRRSWLLLGAATLLLQGAFAQDYHKINKDSLRAILAADALPDTVRAMALHELAKAYLLTNVDTMQKYEQEALMLSKKINFPKGIVAGLQGLGVVSETRGNYRQALNYYFQALEVAEKSNDILLIAIITYSVGVLYDDMEQPERATGYYRKAAALFERLEQPHYLFYAMSAAAEVFLNQAAYDSALHYYRKSLAVAESNHDDRQIDMATTNVGFAFMRQGDYPQALRYFHRTLPLTKSLGDSVSLAELYINMSESYLHTNQYAKADTFSTKALRVATTYQDMDNRIDAHRLNVTLDSAQQRYASALANYQQYVALRDSALSQETTTQINELETKYQTAQKEQQIASLQQKNQIAELRNDNQRIQLYLFLGGFVSAVLLALLWYRRSQLRQRANAQLTAQKQEIEHKNTLIEQALCDKDLLMQEVHHRAKNNLSTIESLLDAQTRRLSDHDAQWALEESRRRVQTITLVHQQLYRTDHPGRIAVAPYVTALLHQLIPPESPVEVKQAVASLTLDIDQIVPLGLILNELVTNAFKYAFPNQQPGALRVALQPTDDHQLQLDVCDDGPGFPDDQPEDSMGLYLVRGLARQLHGQYTAYNDSGACVCITFPARPLSVPEVATADEVAV